MNKDQILTASDTELPALLGEVLQPETKVCDLVHISYSMTDPNWQCTKCDKLCDVKKNWPCTIPDSISLTPDNAFKWRNWAVEKYGKHEFSFAMQDSTVSEFNWDYVPIVSLAKPRHYLIAAALCAMKGK